MIQGIYNLRNSKPIEQFDLQTEPNLYYTVDGFKFPINGSYAGVLCKYGIAYLYSGWSQEVTLYYSYDYAKKILHWGELYRELSNHAKIVPPGKIIKFEGNQPQAIEIDNFPSPQISENTSLKQAIAEYRELLLKAVEKRVKTCKGKIAVSQSGGVDSQLVSWALLELGVDFIPFTTCLSLDSWDIHYAKQNLAAMNGPKPVAILIDENVIRDCIEDAVRLSEDIKIANPKYMEHAVCNIAIARQCLENDIGTIFNGHAQDDIQGGMYSIYKDLVEMPPTKENAKIWQDARVTATKNQQYHWNDNKTYSSIFRSHGIDLRMPYWDYDLVNWTLAQAMEIIPVSKNKPFVKAAAKKILPKGLWNDPGYKSTGYTKGAGWEDYPQQANLVKQLAQQTSIKLFGE